MSNMKKRAGRATKEAKKPKVELDTEESPEMAEIDEIIKERGSGKSKMYLCTWTDGAPPQWVKEVDLNGTPALQEWKDLEDEVPEEFESDEVVAAKCATFARWIRESKRTAWLAGAGLSASVLPTFRGKGGLWTKGRSASKKPTENPPGTLLAPTYSHHALVALHHAGHVSWMASQNYDDLLMRAGFPEDKLSELHGNIYIETCVGCGHVYHRDFEVELPTSHDHETGRVCDQPVGGGMCGGVLRDNIVHFGESLPWHALTMANAKFLSADVSVVLGSSLRVDPAASLPFKAKRRRRAGARDTPRVVIVNLQPTPRDSGADLVIRARCDTVLRTVCDILGCEVNK